MSPFPNNVYSVEQVRSDTSSLVNSTTTMTIHQQDERSAPIIRTVSPGGQTNHPVPDTHSSSTKKAIKLPRWSSKHGMCSKHRIPGSGHKDHRRRQNVMTGTPSKITVMNPPTSILSNIEIIPRPTASAETITSATVGLLSLCPSPIAKKSPTCVGTTTTSPATTAVADSCIMTTPLSPLATPNPGQIVTAAVLLRAAVSQSTLKLPEEKEEEEEPVFSHWDIMFLKHVITPFEERSQEPAELKAGEKWLAQQRFLNAALKKGRYHPFDPFEQIQASCRLNLLQMMGVDV
jgi:hypothetical protein